MASGLLSLLPAPTYTKGCPVFGSMVTFSEASSLVMAWRLGGRASLLSKPQVFSAMPISLRLFIALALWALAFARLRAGSIIAERIARMARTARTTTAPPTPRRAEATISTTSTMAQRQNRNRPAFCSMRLP